MKGVLWAWFWMLAGLYFVVAAIGGSPVAAFAALACGWNAGRAAGHRP